MNEKAGFLHTFFGRYIMSKQADGFTLVEVMVVLALIAVMGAIAVPRLAGRMSQNRLNGATRQVVNDMMWARMQAVTQRNEFRIFFIDEHVYKILDDDDNDGKEDDKEWTRTKDIRDPYYDIRIDSNINPIFFPRGSASMGTVTLTNPGGTKRIRVHITGRVKIT